MTPDKDIKETIDSLCGDLKPVKCMRPHWRSALWIVIAVSYTAAVASMVGFRPQLADKMLDQNFIFEIGLALATGLAASLVTFWLTLPDSSRYNIFLSIPATLFAVHLFWMLDRLMMEGLGMMPFYWFTNCWMDTALMAGLPAAVVVFLIRKGASVRPKLLALNALLAVSSFSWIGIRFTCPFDSVGKAYLMNFAPLMILGLVVGLCAKRLFKW
jgi:hypothetical protein